MYQTMNGINNVKEIIHKLSGNKLITIWEATVSERLALIILAIAIKLK
jgi:hypothetical protein